MNFADKWDAIVWMCRNQLGRRNLTDEQKSYLRGKQYDAEKMSVSNTEGINQYSEVAGQNVRQPKSRREQRDGTAGKVGKEHGVNGRTIRRDSEFSGGLDAAEEASPGIREAILSGEVKAHRTQCRHPQRVQTTPASDTPEAAPEGEWGGLVLFAKPL